MWPELSELFERMSCVMREAALARSLTVSQLLLAAGSGSDAV
jgi:hypothetical protein